jgi:hypothetical protein
MSVKLSLADILAQKKKVSSSAVASDFSSSDACIGAYSHPANYSPTPLQPELFAALWAMQLLSYKTLGYTERRDLFDWLLEDSAPILNTFSQLSNESLMDIYTSICKHGDSPTTVFEINRLAHAVTSLHLSFPASYLPLLHQHLALRLYQPLAFIECSPTAVALSYVKS